MDRRQLGIEFEDPFAETLQSGVILCQLMNEIEGKHKRIPQRRSPRRVRNSPANGKYQSVSGCLQTVG